ncbi:MAG: carbohydrate binding family 9 domain-containing protein [Bacteroidetes bacterium]|nr:carbohydrate binding family 9 domain-containing protein [Bacteroidota bacterium]
MNKHFLSILFLISATITSVSGQAGENYLEIQKVNGEINFDGICNEPLWDNLPLVPMTMFKPNHGSKPSERSDVFVTFDDEYLLIGARLYYENGSIIRSTTKKRDGADGGSDNFGILLDSFNDNENALCFETNPSGLRSDFTIDNDAQVPMGMMPFNRSWDTFWDVKTNIIGKVLHIEIRIPFSSLRFQETDGKVIMGMSIWRQISSKQEWNNFPDISNEYGNFGVWKPSQAHKIVIKGIKRKKPVYIKPYLKGGFEQSHKLNETETAYQVSNNPKLNAGLDVKYSLTSNITADLTLNTDFAQVEVDDQMVNLTRYSLFFPEKRQFFVERSSIFNIHTGYLDQVFYSRRIGLYEGEIVPIIGGARVVGRAGKWDLGFLDMQTTDFDYTDPDTDSVTHLYSANHGVLRLRKQVFNETSYAGGMVTSKIDAMGNYNINTAADMILNPFKNNYITTSYVHTFDNSVTYTGNLLKHAKINFDWQNRATVGLNYDFSFARSGENYDPQMGFEQMENYTQFYGQTGYGWAYNDENKKMLRQYIMVWALVNKTNEDWRTFLSTYSVGYNIALKNGFGGWVDLFRHQDYLTEQFNLSDDVFFPVGSYDYYNYETGFNTPTNRLISFNYMLNIGGYYDGTYINLTPAQVNFRISSNVNLGLGYQYSQVDVRDRDQHFRSHLVRLKSEFTFTTKLSLLMYFQYSSNDKFGVNNIRFRYNPREGNDFYLVYNGDYNTNLNRQYPELPFMNKTNLTVKYTYTFIWSR